MVVPGPRRLLERIVQTARNSNTAQRVRQHRLDAWRASVFASSPWFDAAWYREQSRNVGTDDLEALEHYLEFGERADRDPGPEFDVAAYVTMNPEAAGRALTHFHRTVAAAPQGARLRPIDITDVTFEPIATGWVDTEWIRRTQVAALPDIDDGHHVWVHARPADIDPSPWFDTSDYAAQVPRADPLAHPVEHWVAMRSETHSARAPTPRVVGVDGSRGPVSRHRVRPSSSLERLSIAVMIHAFYVDLLPELLDRLAVIPGSPTLLVSVDSLTDARAAHDAIDTLRGRTAPRVVKVVPNRGRNFAPLLCSFPEELRQHELVLHVHTKKSLFTGAELVDWRSHLLRHLLPSAAGVEAIVSLLSPDPASDETEAIRCGVVQPPSWDQLDPWAIHWFANMQHGQRLYEQMGVSDRVAEGYVMFPVGGMFWARVEALEPLLSLQLTVGDFEREAAQLDSTLAHAIERAIPAAAGVAGFETVELDAHAGQWRVGWSGVPGDDFGSIPAVALDHALATSELVSVGLFGTLLLEPTLTRTGTGQPGFGSHAAELASGARRCLPRTWLIERLRADARENPRRRRYVLMSDTELSSVEVWSLLQDIGLADVIDHLDLASAGGGRKADGSMWDTVARRERVPADRWVHIGASEGADMRWACERLLQYVHTPEPGSVVRRRGVEPSLLPADLVRGTDALIGHSLAVQARRQRSIHDHDSEPQRVDLVDIGTAVVGPLTLAFAISAGGRSADATDSDFVSTVLARVGAGAGGPARTDLAAAMAAKLVEATERVHGAGRIAAVLQSCWTPRLDDSTGAGDIAALHRAALDFVEDHIDLFGLEVAGAPIDPTMALRALARCERPFLPDLDAVLRAIGSATTQ